MLIPILVPRAIKHGGCRMVNVSRECSGGREKKTRKQRKKLPPTRGEETRPREKLASIGEADFEMTRARIRVIALRA
jgi:hypothetical protein